MKRFSIDEFHLTNRLETSFFNKFIECLCLILFKTYRVLILNKNESNKIVILSLNKIGDTVFTIPAIEALIDQYRDRELVIICNGSGKEIYNYFFNIKTVVLSQKHFIFRARIASREARKILNQLDPGIVVDLSSGLRTVSLFINSKAKQIIGLNKKIYKGAYSVFVPIRKTPKLQDMYLDAVSPLINTQLIVYNKPPRPLHSNKKILIHPFAGWEAKEWGKKKFIEAALSLNSSHPVQIVAENGLLNSDDKIELKSKGISFRETNSIYELITEIQNSGIVFSNDTGCIYLAAALGKYTFTVYGPTNPKFSLPEGQHHRYIRKILPCTPLQDQYCFTFAGRIGCPSFECMRQLSTKEVLLALNEFLNEISQSE